VAARFGVGDRQGGSGGFFSPDRAAARDYAWGGRVTWPRLLLRIALCGALLYGADVAVTRTLVPAATYERNYRLPRELPTASLADFVASINAASLRTQGGPIVAFLGASPTWGHRITDPANTFPSAFESAGVSAGWPNRTYNLASNGQFLSDEYFIAKALVDDVEVVYVQLTYHTFNPTTRGTSVVRYPEIPQLLGVDVSVEEAALLGVKPTAADATSRVDTALSRYWLLWRERDALDRRLFGGTPRKLLSGVGGVSSSSLTSLPLDAQSDGNLGSLDDMEPAQRMIAISRYAENSQFDISPTDSEVVFLRMLVKMLAARGKKAVFFMSPLNRQLIDDYELIRPEQYAANVAMLRAIVQPAGFPFIDPNAGTAFLPQEDFSDISHTTDEGGRVFGASLYADTWSYLGAKKP
jgi:hypothetical protein